MSRKTKEVSEIFQYMFKSRVKGIDGGYKLSELLSGRGGSADVVVFEVKFSLGWPNFVPFTQ